MGESIFLRGFNESDHQSMNTLSDWVNNTLDGKQSYPPKEPVWFGVDDPSEFTFGNTSAHEDDIEDEVESSQQQKWTPTLGCLLKQ